MKKENWYPVAASLPKKMNSRSSCSTPENTNTDSVGKVVRAMAAIFEGGAVTAEALMAVLF